MSLETLLSKLEAKAKAATPGEWTSAHQIGIVEQSDPETCCEDFLECAVIARLNYAGRCQSAIQEDHDATYIAAANPSTIKRLVAIIRRQQSVLEEWKDSGEPDFKEALADVERIAGGV